MTGCPWASDSKSALGFVRAQGGGARFLPCFALGRYSGVMTVNPDGPVDPYMQVANAIRAEIVDKKLAVDTKLSPLRELAKTFQVAEMTVGNAIRVLREEGMVYTTKRGTFVSARSEDRAESPDLAGQVADLTEQVRDLTERVVAIESNR